MPQRACSPVPKLPPPGGSRLISPVCPQDSSGCLVPDNGAHFHSMFAVAVRTDDSCSIAPASVSLFPSGHYLLWWHVVIFVAALSRGVRLLQLLLYPAGDDFLS